VLLFRTGCAGIWCFAATPAMNLVTATSNGSCELVENYTAKITHTTQSIKFYDNEAQFKKIL
jgi:hypothetical protein